MDVQKFLNANLNVREAGVPVPALSSFFAGKKKPVWTVRALTAAEFARCREAEDRGERMQSLIKAFAGKGDKAAEIRKAMGLDYSDTPIDVSKRIEMLAQGSVDPVIGDEHRDVAVRLAEMYPIIFYELTNKIHELTLSGAELGKPKRSGKTRK